MFIVERMIKWKFPALFVLMCLSIAAGQMLGTCYEFYVLIPFFDIILHGISGFVFACLGFSLLEVFIGKATSKRKFWACVYSGVCFTLAIGLLWELFEYSATFLGVDMLEDSYIFHIDSYLLAGNHSEVVEIDGITKTIIYYGDGQTMTIDGYLDIGLLDTMHDMGICLIGSMVFVITACIGYFKFPKINELLIPDLGTEK
jgi:hypothetical protein